MTERPIKEKIVKFREYLDYVERHYDNVQKAWIVIQDKCKNMQFIYDDSIFWCFDSAIKKHDESKLSEEEFFAYRNYFYPVSGEVKNKKAFNESWEHHWKNNDHHWQNWTAQYGDTHNLSSELCLVHNIIDWMAMGYEFGDTAQEYYESNKDKIHLPEWAIKTMYDIFENLKK